MTENGRPSVWQRALGESFDSLDPALRAYFGGIPDGHEGRGTGVFDRIGTPKRWFWPVLALLGRAGILFPVWEHDVPFTITNSPTADGLRSRRVFHLARGDRAMVDEIVWTPSGLVDRLGTAGIVESAFDALEHEGRMELTARRTRLRLGRLRIPIPGPRVTLVERTTADGRQHVALVMRLPLLGRVYEYSGGFDYAVVPA